jgi:hypothetical protein
VTGGAGGGYLGNGGSAGFSTGGTGPAVAGYSTGGGTVTVSATATGGFGGPGGDGASVSLSSDGGSHSVVGGATTGALYLTQSATGGEGGSFFPLQTGGSGGDASSRLRGDNPSSASNYSLAANATGGAAGFGSFDGSPRPGGSANAETKAISSVANDSVSAS